MSNVFKAMGELIWVPIMAVVVLTAYYPRVDHYTVTLLDSVFVGVLLVFVGVIVGSLIGGFVGSIATLIVRATE